MGAHLLSAVFQRRLRITGRSWLSAWKGVRGAVEHDAEARATIEITIPHRTVEALAERVAELLSDRLGPQPETWIGVEEAAVHLACPKSRIYDLVSARRIPHERDGSWLLFRRSALDGWVTSGGGRR